MDSNLAYNKHTDTTQATPKTIPLAKIAELREIQRKYSLKMREEYNSMKKAFIADRHLEQKTHWTNPVHSPTTTDTMADTGMKVFFGDYNRSDEDLTTWMQSLNTRRVANNWTNTKTMGIFKSLLAEGKRAYHWWHQELQATDPTIDRTSWIAVKKAFKERWPLLPELDEDMELKREELEQMRLRDEELGSKVTYQVQELYTHVTFANKVACLANKIGDTNGFLLPSIRKQLPEVVQNTLKSQGTRPRTWDKFRRAIMAIPLSDL